MINFNILVTGAPFDSTAAHSALKFCRAVLKSGHSIQQVFFYQQGVHIASPSIQLLDDDFSARDDWLEFSGDNAIRLCACVSASENRGVSLDLNEESQIEIVGLGQLYEASLAADRTVTFK